MENKRIIIILVAVIVVLAAILGVMFLHSSNAKEQTMVKITSDKSQYEGAKLSIQLSDLNKNAISDEIVNVTVTDSKGEVVFDDVVKTNSKGRANLDLELEKGNYVVDVSYGGNDNYTGNNTTQKLTIKEKAAEQSSSESSTSQGWTTESPGGDAGSRIVIYHDGNGHKYVTRYSADGSSSEDGIAYDEDALITS